MKKLVPISILVLLALGFGYKFWEYKYNESHPSNGKDTTSIASSVFSHSSSDVEARSINVKTEEPVNGRTRGVIEVGASGFNSFVINSDKQGRWKLLYKEFGSSLAYEGFASVEDVKVGLTRYIAQMLDRGVSPKDIHFVVSSGALKNSKTPTILQGIKAKGYFVNEVSATQEGQYALKALLPQEYKDNSFTVDIGSGNTKVSWYEGNKLVSKESYGAKYFQNGTSDEAVYTEVANIVKGVPSQNKKYCFIIGGIPFTLAKKSRTNETERFTVLSDPSSYDVTEAKSKAGVNIYRAVYDNSTHDVIFDWDANFTIGFLLGL